MIVWGTKKVTRKYGFVAESCPICKVATAYQVKRVGLAGHIWWIALAKGSL